MTWFKVDDSFYDHPKIAELSMAARGLWVTAGSYCSRHLTDGHITGKQVRKLGGTAPQVRDLVRIGVWIECELHSESNSNCYAFHDWIEMQPTRESEKKRLAIQAERKRKSRERKWVDQPEPENVTRDDLVTAENVSRVTSTSRTRARGRRPDPTRPKEVFGYVNGEGYVSDARDEQPPTPTCPQHPNGTPDACAACMHARKVREAWDETLHEADVGKRRTRRQRIDACEWCDNQGIRIEPSEMAEWDLPAVRCDHTPLTLDGWRERFAHA